MIIFLNDVKDMVKQKIMNMDINNIIPSFTKSWMVDNNGTISFGFDYNIDEISLIVKVEKSIPLTGLIFIPLCLIVLSYLNNRYSSIIKSAIIYYKDIQIGFSDKVFDYLKNINIDDFIKDYMNIFTYNKNNLEIEILTDGNLYNMIGDVLNKNIFDVYKYISITIIDYNKGPNDKKIEFYIVRHRK